MASGCSAGFLGLIAAAGLVLTLASQYAAAADPPPEQHVTVEGHQERLERRVREFVAEITLGGSDTSLQRWTEPVCPLVAGMSKAQGEGVLTRLSQIAKQAGARLAPEHCEPNLIIVVTSDPPALIQAWRSQTQGRIFNGAAPMTIRHFIQTARPVRVWYNTAATTLEGVPLNSGSMHTDPAQTPVPVNTQADDTRLAPPVLMNLSSVILVVDLQSLQHLTVGQLADYVAMVGLGRLDTSAHTTDVPTIMNLFTTTDGRPTGLTQWDEAYLHALYHTRLTSRMQRSAITRSVVREVEKFEK
jgi:hypothetical protein